MANRRNRWDERTATERREAARLEGEELATREHNDIEPEVAAWLAERQEEDDLSPEARAALREEERREQDDL